MGSRVIWRSSIQDADRIQYVLCLHSECSVFVIVASSLSWLSIGREDQYQHDGHVPSLLSDGHLFDRRGCTDICVISALTDLLPYFADAETRVFNVSFPR